jgi:hypothetical protein
MGRLENVALIAFKAVDFSASLAEDREIDFFGAGLIHPLPTELASVGSTRLRGRGVDKSYEASPMPHTKPGRTCPLDFGAKTAAGRSAVLCRAPRPRPAGVSAARSAWRGAKTP